MINFGQVVRRASDPGGSCSSICDQMNSKSFVAANPARKPPMMLNGANKIFAISSSPYPERRDLTPLVAHAEREQREVVALAALHKSHDFALHALESGLGLESHQARE